MITTLDAVTAHFAPQLPANAFAEVRRQLVNQHETISTRLLDDEQAMVEAAENLRTGRTRVADLSINHKDFSAFGPGLYRVYRRGRRCMTAAYNQGDPALFHEWRKQVKYLWHQVEILQPLWPTMLESLALDLHQLSDYLGQTHDLAVLRQTLHALPEPFNHNVDRAELATLIDQWQVEFETAAQPLGAQIYAEKPGRFVERMATYWAIWQSL
jgi:CHAD domain-containing protein